MKNVYLAVTRLLTVLIFCIALQPLFAQNGVAIAAGTSATADNSAMLDVQSTSKGVLIPRMSTTNRLAITNPANGLLVYDNTLNYFMYYTGGPTGNISTDWIILNSGTIGSTGGTANYVAKYNATNGLTISQTFDNGTSIGIGTAVPAAAFDVQNPITATTATTYGTRLQQTLTAHANSDALTGLYINPTFTNGSYTSVGNYGLIVASGNVGINNAAPIGLLEIGNGGATGKLLINSQDNYSGQVQIGNPVFGAEASMSFISGVSTFGTTGVNPTVNGGNYRVWNVGAGIWGIGGNKFGIGNNGIGGAIMTFDTLKNVAITNLAGTGNRPVSADASGNLRVGSSLGYSSGNKATFTYSTSSGTGTSGTPSTGATWTIPAGVTQAYVKLWGAGGGGNTSGGSVGGGGGFIAGWLTWPSGTTSLTIIVGGGGGLGNTNGSAGTNGGGSSAYQGGGGGGRSCIQIAGTDYVAAGGGGGSINGCYCRGGGAGGGGQGLPGYYTSGSSGQATGGTQIAGGTSGTGNSAASAHVGASHTGGSGASYGGGGGGGWFGGGAGGNSSSNGNDGSGAGGSSGGNSTYFTFGWGEPGQMYFSTNQPTGPIFPGGLGDPDYVYGVGFGGMPSAGSSFPNNTGGNGGNGYVAIYW